MIDKVFVDTNILVYSKDMKDPVKHRRSVEVLEKLWQDRNGAISTQVCSEYFVTVTRKLKPGMSEEDAYSDIEALLAWNPYPVDADVLKKARECQILFGLSWWDSLTVAAAHFSGCGTILTEDLNHGQEYFGVFVKNPFLPLPT